MKLSHVHIALIIALQETLLRLTPRAQLESVEFHTPGKDDPVIAGVNAKFGPTHRVALHFEGTLDRKLFAFGPEWSLACNQDGISTCIGSSSKDEDLEKMRADLGIV